jgi:peptide-methionine (R)-S-oxide reductase
MKNILTVLALVGIFASCNAQTEATHTDFKVKKTEAEWKKQLTEEEYQVLRKKGTERPGTGTYNKHYKEGIYTCAACNFELFKSDHKYDSGSGWPAFDQPANETAVVEESDVSYGMTRTEVLCANCGGHLGHVFNDGPRETTGMRYCINSVSLGFIEKK